MVRRASIVLRYWGTSLRSGLPSLPVLRKAEVTLESDLQHLQRVEDRYNVLGHERGEAALQ